MVKVLGRQNDHIFFPPELVAGNDLGQSVREMLPLIASYPPEKRNAAIEKLRRYLKPGAQRGRGAAGILPAIGITLTDTRMAVRAEVMQAPALMAAGVRVPASMSEFFPQAISKARYNVPSNRVVTLNVVVFHHPRLQQGAARVYDKIRDMVNKCNSTYRFNLQPQLVATGDMERHWGAIERFFSQRVPDNLFVLDFAFPARGSSDPAYGVVKEMLCSRGFLSQFVNFKTCAHDRASGDRDMKKSDMILQGVARQILQKSGVR